MAFTRRAALAAALSAAAFAAHANEPYEPQRGQAGKDVIWIPTPNAAVTRMLQMAEVKPTDHVVDLGAGDGKIAIAAAREFGATARGLEYNPKLVDHAKRLAEQAGVAKKVSFEQADIFESDFSNASVVTMYLLPHLNLKLRPTLLNMKPGTRVVSHSFSMAEWRPDERSRIGTAELMLWYVPANASGNWTLKFDGREVAIELWQQFQVLRGEASVGPGVASLVEPRIRADRLRFGLRDGEGVLHQFDGQVQGDRFTGSVSVAGRKAPLRFEGVRTGGKADLATPIPRVTDVVIE